MGHAVARVRIADFDQFIETFSTKGLNKRSEHGSRRVRIYRSADDSMAEAGLEGPPEWTFVELAGEFEA